MKGYHHTRPRVSPPFVTASKHGHLVVNKPAMMLLQQRGVTHVCLLWDAAEQTLALQPAPATARHAFRLNYRQTQVALNVPHFWKHVGVSLHPGGRRLLAAWDEETNLLVAKLNSDTKAETTQP